MDGTLVAAVSGDELLISGSWLAHIGLPPTPILRPVEINIRYISTLTDWPTYSSTLATKKCGFSPQRNNLKKLLSMSLSKKLRIQIPYFSILQLLHCSKCTSTITLQHMHSNNYTAQCAMHIAFSTSEANTHVPRCASNSFRLILLWPLVLDYCKTTSFLLLVFLLLLGPCRISGRSKIISIFLFYTFAMIKFLPLGHSPAQNLSLGENHATSPGATSSSKLP